MSLTLLGSFVAVIGVLIAAPGPDWAFTLHVAAERQSLTAAVTGLVIGYLGLTVVVAVGVGRLVAERDGLLGILTSIGAIYLVWLGVRAIRHPPAIASEGPGRAYPVARPRVAVLVVGVGVSGLNPKGLLVFLAVLPQFTSPRAAWPLGAQLAGLGVTFAACVAVFYAVLGTLAARAVQQRPEVGVLLSRVAGVAMLALAAVLAVQHF